MCERCVRKLKHTGVPKNKYGHIKAFAHRYIKPFHFRATKSGRLYIDGVIGMHCDRRFDIGVEAHLHKILRARTNKKIYNRKRGHGLVA